MCKGKPKHQPEDSWFESRPEDEVIDVLAKQGINIYPLEDYMKENP